MENISTSVSGTELNKTNSTIYNERKHQFRFFFDETVLDEAFNYICLIIAILGVIGNIVTIIKISCQSRLHTPTFVAINCLGVQDLVSIILTTGTLTNIVVILPQNWLNLHNICVSTAFFSSSGHILLLPVVRCIILVHPLHGRQYLTTTFVSLGSLSVWILSFSFCLLVRLFLFTNCITDTAENIFVLLIIVIECLVVVLLVILMHKRKLMILRQSSVSRQTLRKMTLIVTLIIGIFLFFRLIQIIFMILLAFFETEFFLKNMYVIVNLIALINFSSNPYILFMQHFFNSSRKYFTVQQRHLIA